MSILRSALRELRLWNPVDAGIVSASNDPRVGWTSWAGVPVNEMRALQQTTVWACVSLISDTLAQLPIASFTKNADDFPTKVKNQPRILSEPHAEMEWTEWLGRLGVSVLLRGNGQGLIIERDRRGDPQQVLPLHPDEVVPKRVAGRLYYKAARVKEDIPATDMLHVKGLTLPGMFGGLDPVRYARHTIGSALGAEEFAGRFFAEAANPSSVLMTEQDIEQGDADRMLDQWEESHGQRSRRPAMLTKGLQWKPISLNAEESQFLQTIKAKRSEIAGFWRCPPHMVGDVERSTSWGTGIEEQNLMFTSLTMGIWITRFERAITRMLLPPGQYAKFNVAGLLRGRFVDQAQGFLIARNGGWMNIDEIRDKIEMAPLADGMGQDYLQPLNYGVIPPGGGPAFSPPPAPVDEPAA